MKNRPHIPQVKPRKQAQKTDTEIDQLVYKLYNLSQKEITILERET